MTDLRAPALRRLATRCRAFAFPTSAAMLEVLASDIDGAHEARRCRVELLAAHGPEPLRAVMLDAVRALGD